MNKRKRISEEINLTPLLDALFSILFIVMLSGVQSERINQNNADALKDNINILQQDIQRLEDEKQQLEDELLKMHSINKGLKQFDEDTLILTLQYISNNQSLSFSQGKDGVVFNSVSMNGSGDPKSEKEYLTNYITNKINAKIYEENKNGPIFIIFNFDNNIIVKDKKIIDDSLNKLQSGNSHIFKRENEGDLK